ncbi:hypothetical protein [Plantactinospora sp. KLBMP9567]|uniref:hypothetical protein n=1 Tax=Plantactinospora sp. KLBMP9567 TaxID=3085900 RepID=UPI00298281FC|nr:hypothetical protein [Plantactinospora sp. KLBMP9567]MDW5323642.1 hypothetical protein [Plantactinospora sp. KLBMP9567]
MRSSASTGLLRNSGADSVHIAPLVNGRLFHVTDRLALQDSVVGGTEIPAAGIALLTPPDEVPYLASFINHGPTSPPARLVGAVGVGSQPG